MPTDAEQEGRALSRWENDGGQIDRARDVVQRMMDTEPLPVERQGYGMALARRMCLNLAGDGGWFSLMITAAIVAGILALLIL